MKTERRHDLETNVLAKELAVWTESVKPHANKILAVLGLLAGLYIAGNLWSSHQREQNKEFWDVYQTALSAGDPEYKQIQQIALSDEYSGAEGKEWALLSWADRQSLIAASDYLVDRKQAFERLDSVLGVYDQLSRSASNSEIKERAKFGLARANEMQGKIKEAKQHYSSVRGILQPMAAERLKALENPVDEQAVEWLATAELPKRATLPGGGIPGVRPDFGAELPDTESDEAFDPTSSISDLLKNIEASEEQTDQSRYSEEEATEGDASEAQTSEEQTSEEQTSEEQPSEEQTSESASETDSAKSE